MPFIFNDYAKIQRGVRRRSPLLNPLEMFFQ